MIVGFTGSRLGTTADQRRVLMSELHRLGATELHHGDCQGADKHAHVIGRQLGLHIVGHPPKGNGLRAFTQCDEWREPAEFMVRNRTIVVVTQMLIATPDGPERLRSGTWATVRHARRMQRPWIVISPLGEIRTWESAA